MRQKTAPPLEPQRSRSKRYGVGAAPLTEQADYTMGQVAAILNVSSRTAVKWCDSGHLTCYRLPMSGDRRVTREEFVAFAAANGMAHALRRHGLAAAPVAVGVECRVAGTPPAGWSWRRCDYATGLLAAAGDSAVALAAVHAGVGLPHAKEFAAAVRVARKATPPLLVYVAAPDHWPATTPAGFDLALADPIDPAALWVAVARRGGRLMPHPEPAGPAECLAVVAPIAARVARRNFAEADDLAQEAMAAVVEHWGRYDPAFGKSRRAWVRELAGHAITDAFRRSAVGRSVVRVPRSAYARGVRRFGVSLDAPAPAASGERPATYAECVPARPESGDPDPDEFLRLAASLAGRLLTAGERNAIVLHYVDGLTVTEAAARLGYAGSCTVVTILAKFAADCRGSGGGKLRLGVAAPKGVTTLREELLTPADGGAS